MNTIIDNITEVEFLPWVESQGMTITLTGENGWVRATLNGTQQAISCRGEAWIEPFTGFGKNKQAAIAALAANCSGQCHHPNARSRFMWISKGDELRFPLFT